MNRILTGLLALILFGQATTFSALNDIQAGRVASIVGNILEGHHFKRAKFDDITSSAFLTNYLNALDYNHMFFLQSDIDNFKAKYGTKLDDLTKSQSVSAAFQIFDIYLERLEERNILVQKLLDQEFDFSEEESFVLARNKEPWPKDDAESAKLWRQRIKYELLQARLAKEKPEETIGLIKRRYNRLEKTMKDLKREDTLQLYLTSLAHVYDPHSDYMSPSEAQNFDIQHISLSLTGIGAQLVQEDGYTKIKDLIPGGPAALSKQLRPSDKIVAVAQGTEEPVDVVEMPLRDVVELIRGKKGTEVKLTIVPAKSPDTKKVISLVRDEIKFKEQFAKARVFDYTDVDGVAQKIGVVTLPQFYDNCASHVETLIERLKKENITALVLDLRRNGGGILDEAVQLTGLFIKKGPVVQVKEPRKEPHVLNDSDSKLAWEGPLVVAVGKLSASASEIVAGALQDYGRAVVVGDQSTHGKGTVQQVLALETVVPKNLVENPGKLKMTVSKFYRVSGTTTQKQGVTPDIILPSIYDYLDIGEGALENALPADQTTPATYTALEQVKPYLPELLTASKVRVSQSKDFGYLVEDIEQVKKRKDEKTISLNEKVRIAERDEDKARIEQRKKERAGRTKPSSHIFELDLDMAMANQPLKPFDPNANKEESDLAQSTPATGEGSEASSDDLEAETDPLVDPHLDETLEITRHYLSLLGKGPKPGVALKNRAAAEKN
ncbi:MAG TPA: carboxy terminal-processing peptidase [Verrucomicrobiae bacterium]